jgi:hypothetical protein
MNAAMRRPIFMAMFLGMGFYAGFIVDSNNMPVVAKQLRQLMTHGLLDRRQTGPSLAITPPVRAAPAVDDFVPTCPELTG